MVDQVDGWLSSKDAAHRIGVTQRTLYRINDEARLPDSRIGRVKRLKELDVEAFIEAGRIRPGTLQHLYPESKKPSDSV